MTAQPALRIVSGGQTGVDRAALDAALEAGVSCGGWCPQGRKAEDGSIDLRYPLTELPKGDYRDRTLKNVQDSDGTVIIFFTEMSGGTALTHRFCIEQGKPVLALDAGSTNALRAAHEIHAFVRSLPGDTLNFAGPRASGEPRAYAFTREVTGRLIRAISSNTDESNDMKRTLVSNGNPMEKVVGFSRAVRVGPWISIGGTAPVGEDGSTVGIGDPAAQARRCLEIIREALDCAGASLDDVVRTRVLLTRIEDWKAVIDVRAEYFSGVRPVDTIMQVSGFVNPEWLVEFEADAVVSDGGEPEERSTREGPGKAA